tara:strand:- start:305 stop:487 length:183 start_codon:yes stop_codon:yes gene_type:complete
MAIIPSDAKVGRSHAMAAMTKALSDIHNITVFRVGTLRGSGDPIKVLLAYSFAHHFAGAY